MSERQDSYSATAVEAGTEIDRFTDSYASFDRIINGLQRQYIQLKEEFSAQNEQLVETNRRLVEMTARNLTATEFLNSILHSISAGVIAVNQDGRITHFNPAASVLLGIPLEVPPGKHYRDIIPPGDPIDANALRAAESGRETEMVEKQMILSDGMHLKLSVSTAILRDDEGRATGAVEIFHDLTKVKKMETEIARLNILAALGEMAAAIAHQVRNPLAGIGGFAALLKRDMDMDDSRRKTVDKIIRGVDSLDQTITSLLNYTRSEEVSREEVDYADYLRLVIEQFRQENSDMVSGMSFKLEISEAQPELSLRLSIDKQLCRELLHNLFTNAVEACDGKGEIIITCGSLSRQEASSRYDGKLLLGQDETVIETTVADNGSGIEKEALDSVFAPFFTTKQGGNGLGLAVSWKIVKAHGGEIVAENITGGGARFRLLFPARIDSVSTE